MKKLVALILAMMLLFTSCGTFTKNNATDDHQDHSVNVEDTGSLPDVEDSDEEQPEDNTPEDNQPDNGENPDNNQPDNGENPDSGENPDNNQPDNNQPDDNKQDCSVVGHKYSSHTVTTPTCEDAGTVLYVCSVCADSYVEYEGTALGHSYKSSVTAPTCDKEGYTTYTCSTCNASYTGDATSALGHNYKSTVTNPTCDGKGYTTYTCSVCSDSYIANEVASLGHNYNSSVTAPTCDKEGYTTYNCTVCGSYYKAEYVSALGHNYKSVVTAATCSTAGYTTYTCSTCNDSYVSDQVAALGHSYKSVVTAATCSTAGYTTYTCSTCNDSYVSDQVAALGHSYKSSVTAPTCEADGYTTYTCSTCGDNYTANIVVAIGHAWVDATTSAPQTCTNCGATVGEKLPDSSGGSSSGYSDILYVTYINVGQGDSILIQVGDCDILIDAGTASYGTTVSNYLKSEGVDDIELMINTHPDADHCGGLTQVLTDYVVEQVWISKDTSKTTAAYKNFISAVSKEGLTAKQPNVGAVFTYEYLTLTVLYSDVGSDSNNSSIVIMMEYGSYRFLFTGDVGEEVETQLVNSGKDLSCDVLKVGHHGSKYSSTAAFLSATGADYGVICVGSNSYGHPTSETLNRLSSAGISVYRTDLNGNVVFSSNGATLTLPGGTTVSGGGSGSGSSSGGSSSGGSTPDSTEYFIGNTETKVFHLPTCSNLPAASKQNTMYNYWWIINIAGYTPCGRCLSGYSSSSTTYIANSDTKVYHLSTCSYLPSASKQIKITNTAGYTPCGHCIGTSSTVKYIANTESKVYHLSTCSYLPALSKQKVITNTAGYTPCGHCLG